MKKALLLKAPGTNNDIETKRALEYAGAEVDTAYIGAGFRVPELKKYGIIVIPGGFSFGDYLGAGKIMALHIKKYLYEELSMISESGRIITGICNGFQVLARLGFFKPSGQILSFEKNIPSGFISKWVKVRPDRNCGFFRGLPDVIDLPIANSESRAVFSSLPSARPHRISPAMTYEENPCGACEDMAACVNPEGNVLGIMPHPERAFYPFQHPACGYGEVKLYGKQIFRNIVQLA